MTTDRRAGGARACAGRQTANVRLEAAPPPFFYHFSSSERECFDGRGEAALLPSIRGKKKKKKKKKDEQLHGDLEKEEGAGRVSTG